MYCMLRYMVERLTTARLRIAVISRTAFSVLQHGRYQLLLNLWKYGAPEGIRTPGLCLRRAALYPAELRVRWGPLSKGKGAPPELIGGKPVLCRYFGAPLIGWNLPRPQEAPIGMGGVRSTVMMSTEQSCGSEVA